MDYKEYFRRIYEVEDPWHYGTSLFEKVRFGAMTEFALACSPETVLDLGCGEGHFLEYLLRRAPGLRVTAVELEPVAAARCQARLAQYGVSLHVMDLVDFLAPRRPADSGLYDVAVCGDVLYYLPPQVVSTQVVPGVAHLVRSGGGLVLSYADANDHEWSLKVFRSRFKLEKRVYIKPVQDPPPWPWMVALLAKEGSCA